MRITKKDPTPEKSEADSSYGRKGLVVGFHKENHLTYIVEKINNDAFIRLDAV